MASNSDVEDEIEELKPHVGKIRQDLEVTEALARASMMTPASASARLTAKRLQLNAPSDFMPPRDVLLYLVRMGSFQSTPRINNKDMQDDDYHIAFDTTRKDLLALCKEEKPASLSLLKRTFQMDKDLSEHFQNMTIKLPDDIERDPKTVRVLQWNILSQTLGRRFEKFISCPLEVFNWRYRRFNIVEEILRCQPDIICLQEVDHFSFLQKILNSQGYEGVFCPKPDSPCLYIDGNNGPDGCCIFFDQKKYDCIDIHTKVLEVWKVKSNQVAIVVNIKSRITGEEICVATTHLKAKRGALLARLRDEQVRDLLNFIKSVGKDRPIVLCGDFNGEPTEPFYKTLETHNDADLISAYAKFHQQTTAEVPQQQVKLATFEYPYTTWKIREDVEECHTIDYIFYSKGRLRVQGVLGIPTGEEIGPGRLPSISYPSDHFSLVADIAFV